MEKTVTANYRILSVEQVVRIRKEIRQTGELNFTKYATELKVGETTIARAVRGESHPDANDQEPPVTRQERGFNLAMTPTQVIELRRSIRENNKLTFTHYAKKYGVSQRTISLAARGGRYQHVDAIEPPVSVALYEALITRKEERVKARALVQEGYSYNQIVKELKVAKSSVSLWCRDLRALKVPSTPPTPPKRDLTKTPKDAVIVVKPKKMRTRNGAQILTDEMVLELRKAIREDGHMRLNLYAAKYGVQYFTISAAARGKTFKHLDTLEPPITIRLPFVRKEGVRRQIVTEDLAKEIIALRRADPKTWSYTTLAKWVSEKTGKHYRGNNVSRIILHRHPELKALEIHDIKPTPAPKPPKEPKPAREPRVRASDRPKVKRVRVKPVVEKVVHTHECAVCEETFTNHLLISEVCSKRACWFVIQEYNAVEKEMAHADE